MNRSLVLEVVRNHDDLRVSVVLVAPVAGRLYRDHETVGDGRIPVFHDAHLLEVGARAVARLALNTGETLVRICCVTTEALGFKGRIGRCFCIIQSRGSNLF